MNDIPGLAPDRDDRGPGSSATLTGGAAVDPILAGHVSGVTHCGNAGEDHDHLTGGQSAIAPHDGDAAGEPRCTLSLEEIEETCGALAQAVAQWSFLVKQKNMTQNRTRAFIRCHKFGWRPTMSEKESAEIERKVERAMKEARAGTLDDPVVTGIVLASDQAAATFAKPAESVMRQAEKLMKLLPAATFVNATRGLGLASVAKIIGSTGPLHAYATPAKLWKRLGLGLVQEAPGTWRSQGKRSSLELAELHGYSPARRSISWNLYDSMFKNQSPEYRAIYDAKKVAYLARVEAGETNAKGHKLTRLWAEKAARRYVEKRVLLHLWRAWRDDVRHLDGVPAEETEPYREAA